MRTLYFNEFEDFAAFKPAHISYMEIEGIKEMEIYKAIRIHNTGFIYCILEGEVGDKDFCTKIDCSEYTPRNKKGGICKHSRLPLEADDKPIMLKIK